VITDQTMPRMTGLQLARTLHATRPDLPIVLYTGYWEGLAAEDLQAAGIHAVLHKPSNPGRSKPRCPRCSANQRGLASRCAGRFVTLLDPDGRHQRPLPTMTTAHPIRSLDDLARFEAALPLEERLPGLSVFDVFVAGRRSSPGPRRQPVRCTRGDQRAWPTCCGA